MTKISKMKAKNPESKPAGAFEKNKDKKIVKKNKNQGEKIKKNLALSPAAQMAKKVKAKKQANVDLQKKSNRENMTKTEECLNTASNQNQDKPIKKQKKEGIKKKRLTTNKKRSLKRAEKKEESGVPLTYKEKQILRVVKWKRKKVPLNPELKFDIVMSKKEPVLNAPYFKNILKALDSASDITGSSVLMVRCKDKIEATLLQDELKKLSGPKTFTIEPFKKKKVPKDTGKEQNTRRKCFYAMDLPPDLKELDMNLKNAFQGAKEFIFLRRLYRTMGIRAARIVLDSKERVDEVFARARVMINGKKVEVFRTKIEALEYAKVKKIVKKNKAKPKANGLKNVVKDEAVIREEAMDEDEEEDSDDDDDDDDDDDIKDEAVIKEKAMDEDEDEDEEKDSDDDDEEDDVIKEEAMDEDEEDSDDDDEEDDDDDE